MDKILEIAQNYQRRGWQPIPMAHRSKNPNLSGWQKFQTVEADLPNHLNGKPQNIGILLDAEAFSPKTNNLKTVAAR